MLSHLLTPCPPEKSGQALKGVIVANLLRLIFKAILPLRAPTFRGRGDNFKHVIILFIKLNCCAKINFS